ncbi:uncharacterized protein MYCFIDRAFT_199823 [Pseudocercospora fijiensis CIRAD86]|uniref:Uncharacterized protein n=1 Tax=Pseudocercospora fijiensis (strain CIRAD86) TaxID=383855 RepID=M3A2R1_PSEFD|nr:uncharacterized protein MYCFIDRAFT_199823 [Pseudocercospora fijiensis CIRAD86]EME78681.1 hypothetical protein MYCFIDRAFT_199823 [Pseudocercospora fijiensis CIRAD86]
MSRAPAIPEKSCLKQPRNPPFASSTESNRATKKHVLFEVSAESSIQQEGQGGQKIKRPSLLPPISRPGDESDQIELARKRTALCQRLVPVRKKMLKWKKYCTEDADKMDMERLTGMFTSVTSQADNEEDATLLKDAIVKIYRDIFAQYLTDCKDSNAAQRSEAIPDHNEPVQEIAQPSTIEANTTSEAKDYSAHSPATSNEGTDFEAKNSAEHGQVKVVDSPSCRTKNLNKWIIANNANVECQLTLRHPTNLTEWRMKCTLHRLPCVQSMAPPRLSVDILPVAYGVWPLLPLLGQAQTATAPLVPRQDFSIAKTKNAIDNDLQNGENQRDTPSQETLNKDKLLVLHRGQPVGILISKSPATTERHNIHEAPPIALSQMNVVLREIVHRHLESFQSVRSSSYLADEGCLITENHVAVKEHTMSPTKKAISPRKVSFPTKAVPGKSCLKRTIITSPAMKTTSSSPSKKAATRYFSFATASNVQVMMIPFVDRGRKVGRAGQVTSAEKKPSEGMTGQIKPAKLPKTDGKKLPIVEQAG